jgi:phosphoglucomutase
MTERSGTPVPRNALVNIPRLVAAYYTRRPDPSNPAHRVVFGTSGHRGSSFTNSFNEEHVAAICRAICELRRERGITGPLFLGMDTHALSEAAFITAVEVFAAEETDIMIQAGLGATPTPVISHAILTFNRGRQDGLADGVVITPSHNPPEDGGIKYNPPSGGPADTTTTKRIQDRANELLGSEKTRGIPIERALKVATTHVHDYIVPYVRDLRNVVDLDAIAHSGLHLGVDPMGGSGLAFWEPIADLYGLHLDVVNPFLDPTFSFMPLDRDGKIRMDCSSPWAMARLVDMKNDFDIAFGNDPDYDRHGIVTPDGGLLNPNHYLASAVWYLFRNREAWNPTCRVGKTLVTSSMLDRVAVALGRVVLEVPVGFKWFVDGLLEGTCAFGGEESAGASFLRRDGTVWTTDKDGFIMDLLAAEITARSGKTPSELYSELTKRFGTSFYERRDIPATTEQKKRLAALDPSAINATHLAGEPITAILSKAPGNGAPIGGIKVTTENGWFAARPSGTEDLYKIYAESFLGEEHLQRLLEEAQAVVARTFSDASCI